MNDTKVGGNELGQKHPLRCPVETLPSLQKCGSRVSGEIYESEIVTRGLNLDVK